MTITKNMKYADLLSLLNGEEPAYGCSKDALVEFIQHEMALNAKKNAAPKAPSKAQIAKAEDNKALAQTLYNVLFLQGKPMTVAEIKTLQGMGEYSSPKITALLKILILDNKVVKDDAGRVAKYQAKA